MGVLRNEMVGNLEIYDRVAAARPTLHSDFNHTVFFYMHKGTWDLLAYSPSPIGLDTLLYCLPQYRGAGTRREG